MCGVLVVHMVPLEFGPTEVTDTALVAGVLVVVSTLLNRLYARLNS